MRTIECDECGALLTAPNDTELAGRLANHLRDEHDEVIDEEAAGELVSEEAYDATDS
jgi:hypothetical protein